MSSSANNILNAPVNVLWRIEAQSQADYTGLVAASMGNSYWIINSPTALYHVWHNLDAGGADPAPVGSTPIEVAISTGDSATVMATAAAAAIDAEGDFGSVSAAGLVTTTNAAVGEVTDAADFDSGVIITICRQGKDFDCGLLVGDIEFSMAPSNLNIQAHQTGVTTLGLLHQGVETLEATTVLQETTRSKLKELYKVYGGSFTPGGGTEVFGVGTAAIGSNLLIKAARLEFKPVTTVSTELSYDVNMPLALPIPDSLTFSGESPRTLNVSWQGFPDTGLNSLVDTVLIGDAEQAGL